ncbi:MAG: DUF1801 domain-containing protein [Phycisphaerales bacterium]|nr:DUF1801 domain-containing protein [Phycisphaerales bacterium]
MPAKKTTKKSVKKPVKKTKAARSPARKKTKAKTFSRAKDALNAGSMAESRKDLGQPGSVAIDRLPEPQRQIALAMDQVIRQVVPGCDSVVKWGNACYSVPRQSQKVVFAALMETKIGINLALPGSELPDPEELLEGTGKVMRHVKLRSVDDAKRDGIRDLIRLAAEVGIKGM